MGPRGATGVVSRCVAVDEGLDSGVARRVAVDEGLDDGCDKGVAVTEGVDVDDDKGVCVGRSVGVVAQPTDKQSTSVKTSPIRKFILVSSIPKKQDDAIFSLGCVSTRSNARDACMQ